MMTLQSNQSNYRKGIKMNKTKIEWADYTWNPITGCTKISDGCKNCYAYAISQRFSDGDFSVSYIRRRLEEPKKIKKPSRIFLCSMSDFFHDEVKAEWQEQILKVVKECSQHTFFVLTKRPSNMASCIGVDDIPNLWLGVSVENQATANDRILDLMNQTHFFKRSFISIEPMLEAIDLPECAKDLKWIICGAETGAGKRFFSDIWGNHIKEFARKNNIPFFFKKNGTGKPDLLGQIYREFPVVLLKRGENND